MPQTFVDYDTSPREYFLNGVSTVLDVHTRVSDLYSNPHDQIREQLRLTIETIKERQESELINNPEYGLLASVTDSQRISTLTGAPTPDDLDDLIGKVWKSRVSSWHILLQSRHLVVNVPAVVFHHRQSACSVRSSSLGAVCH